MRNAASAKAAISVPRPASLPVTAYSLTIAYEIRICSDITSSCKDGDWGSKSKASTLGPLRAVLSNILDLENISPDEV